MDLTGWRHSRLDRKSSRGMIYENEELRLRTININAEVERGQSDIKKLRRENYQLRKEIWTLRDEYDRLGKLLKKNNRSIDESGIDSNECISDCKYACNCEEADSCCNCVSNEDNISCDICQENDQCSKQCNDRTSENAANTSAKAFEKNGKINCMESNGMTQQQSHQQQNSHKNDKINMNFDHLSIVSEECLSNSEDQADSKATQNGISNNHNEDDTTFADFQSTVPPLTHFENLSYRDIGPNMDSLPEINYDNNPSENENGNESTSTSTSPPIADKLNKEKSGPIHFFSSFKPKRTTNHVDKPDVFIDNALPTDGPKIATIRKPHTPLKCPNNSNDMIEKKSMAISYNIPDISKGIDDLQLHKDPLYDNFDANKSSDPELSQPYRSEMSLVLSYNGNKSKYSTLRYSDKTVDSDTESPKLPHAMKLFPNKLTYGAPANDRFVTEQKLEVSKDSEKSVINKDNNVNEGKLSHPNVEKLIACAPDRKRVSMDTSSIGEGSGILSSKNSGNDSPMVETKSFSSIKSADSNKSLEKHQDESKEQNKLGRRVSIHCNGKPISGEENEATSPTHTTDYDANCTDCLCEDGLTLTPTSFRLRRASGSRKFSDDSIGSLLYPPTPFFSPTYKRGKKSFFSTAFTPRRHSDIGLFPTPQNQYYPEYNIPTKNQNRHHCHRSHNHHHHHHHNHNHQNASSGLGSTTNNAIHGSNGTSICNSLGESSRESSTSLSQRSTSKRKLSITSHSQGGKIPWCACWGNGCI